MRKKLLLSGLLIGGLMATYISAQEIQDEAEPVLFVCDGVSDQEGGVFFELPTPNQKYRHFDSNQRWTSTATNGGGLQFGDPTVITWSIVPDGTFIPGYGGEPDANSNLRSFLNGIYGNMDTWLPLFQSIFDNWEAQCGIVFVYESNDDGAAFAQNFPTTPGSLGVRGDIRISGHFIDGTPPPNNTHRLAYAFSPNSGDMIIDTGDTTFNDTSNNSLIFRNTIAHEIGHSLGLAHTCPTNQTKLMEPLVTTSFDGPQHDDILGMNRTYGDGNEHNDTPGTATSLGSPLRGITASASEVSIDGDTDVDYYSFTISGPAEVDATLVPEGQTYLEGPQINGVCTAGTSFNSKTLNDLTLEIVDSNGTTVLGFADNTGAGFNETLTAVSLGSGGTYYARISGDTDEVQFYSLELSFTPIQIDCTFEDLIPYWQGDPAPCNGLVPNIQDMITAIINEQPKRAMNGRSYIK